MNAFVLSLGLVMATDAGVYTATTVPAPPPSSMDPLQGLDCELAGGTSVTNDYCKIRPDFDLRVAGQAPEWL